MSTSTHPDGLLFGPTGSGKSYLSMYDHRGRNRRKSSWANDVSPTEEYGIFDRADAGNHVDAPGNLWGVRDTQGTALGTHGERLAKFPFNPTAATPWHGFPVSPANGRASEIPPDDLVDALIEAGALSRTFGRKLQRRKA